MIHDGRTLAVALFGEARGREMDPREYLVQFHPEPEPPTIDVVVRDLPLVAEVHRGIWIARCPCRTPGLPAPGGVVFFDAPVVWCPRCRNRDVWGGWRPVWLPRPEVRAEVERLLSLRPVEAQNWTPDESPEDLARQNAEHGVEAA